MTPVADGSLLASIKGGSASAMPIDVLIPVYNGAPWLRASIGSIQRQTHAALQIHIVDDGSTDATPTILAELAAGDARIRIHRRPNGGIVQALNDGLLQCTAAFVARHDADDIAYPERLQRQLAYLTEHADCVAVGAVARHIDEHGVDRGTVTVLPPPADADADWFPAREPYLMHPFLLARRQALTHAGAYRPVLLAEDSDLYWRLFGLGRLHNLPDILGEYRLHAGSVSAASVHNGRLMAVSSQLAALSARRRAGRRTDVVFDGDINARLRQAVTLEQMVQQAGVQLDTEEQVGFGLAVAAKLLELADYQPYEIDTGDCRSVADAWRGGQHLVTSSANRRTLRRLFTRTAVRLHVAGRKADARALLPAAWLGEFGVRLAVRRGLASGVRRRLHGLLGGGSGASS